jgi:hypothetical protein
MRAMFYPFGFAITAFAESLSFSRPKDIESLISSDMPFW